jgi:hypothetical protein
MGHQHQIIPVYYIITVAVAQQLLNLRRFVTCYQLNLTTGIIR